jgi:ER-bound oxygenase mpaB/B'/Rubber oxygenase, catalytic domain
MMDEQLVLPKLRTLGDGPADEIISQLVVTHGTNFLTKIMPFLSDYHNLSFENQPQILQDFLAKNTELPTFYHKKNIIRATDFYRENQQNIGLILGLYALPYCFLGADGAKVLDLSQRIKNDTYQRLLETGNFLKAVMHYDNWQNGNIFSICLKVRLLHACIRYFTMHAGRWNLAWGYPINQEDMLGTNLAFSLIVLRGMEKLGIRADSSAEEAYINTWNTIGYLLGIPAHILPQTFAEAAKLDKKIAQRQFRQSAEGEALMAALMNTVRNFAPNQTTADLLQEQCRFLLGEKYADMLGIKETKLPKTLLKIYQTTSVLMAKVF